MVFLCFEAMARCCATLCRRHSHLPDTCLIPGLLSTTDQRYRLASHCTFVRWQYPFGGLQGALQGFLAPIHKIMSQINGNGYCPNSLNCYYGRIKNKALFFGIAFSRLKTSTEVTIEKAATAIESRPGNPCTKPQEYPYWDKIITRWDQRVPTDGFRLLADKCL